MWPFSSCGSYWANANRNPCGAYVGAMSCVRSSIRSLASSNDAVSIIEYGVLPRNGLVR